MNILFVGGTGQISLSCVQRALNEGHKVSVFNRGNATNKLPTGVTSIVGDLKDDAAYAKLGDLKFDTVCQFLAFTPDQIDRDIATFAGNVGQYIFISSASAYEKPASHYVITEKTPMINPNWQYSRDKIACEQRIQQSENLPWTIVRPSHTLRTGLPSMLGEGDIMGHRLLAGKPVLVSGDGLTPWTLTRSVDFAVPFVGLFGNAAALGEEFHITSDRGYTWDDIYKTFGAGLGVEANIVHVPADTLIAYHEEWRGPLLGDKSWSTLFDNSKIKSVVGDFTCSEVLSEILKQPVAHFKQRVAVTGPVVEDIEALMDRVAKEQSALGHS